MVISMNPEHRRTNITHSNRRTIHPSVMNVEWEKPGMPKKHSQGNAGFMLTDKRNAQGFRGL
jgi:hypothetical protein